MSDETVILQGGVPSFAYVFWTNGVRRGDHATLRADGSTIGRSGQCDVRLDDASASAEHARVRREGDAWFLYDLASANPTKVGGVVVHRHELADGDRVTIGASELVFRLLG